MEAAIRNNAVHALISNGYAVLPLPPSTAHLVASTFNAGTAFFRLPIHEKLSHSLPFDCGYRAKGIEYSGSEDEPDAIESFTFGSRLEVRADSLRSRRAAELYKSLRMLFATFETFAESLVPALAHHFNANIGVEEWRGAFSRWSFLQLNYSQPSTCTEPFINALHEDGHLLTFACSVSPGLELQSSNSEFIPITTGVDHFIVMPGEILWLLSGGNISPLYHRVRKHEECQERLALLFFCDPNPRKCLPWLANEVNDAVDIGTRVRTNATRFGLTALPIEQ